MTGSEPTADLLSPTSSRRERVAALLWWLLVFTALAAVLLFAFGLVVPHRPGEFGWGAPGLVVASVVLAALGFQVSPPGERLGKALDSIALVLGLASTVMAIGVVLLISVGVSLNFSEDTGSVQSRLYHLTDVRILGAALQYAGVTAAPGLVGLVIAHLRRRRSGSISVAGSARRFSVGGLVASLLIALAVGAAALYRWVTWGIV